MKRLSHWTLPTPLLAAVLASAGFQVEALANTSPELEDPLLAGSVVKVEPKVPVGKALVMPIAARDADGDALSYTVTSSNPKIHVRARTGQPHVRLAIRHTSSGEGDVAFQGELDFQVFRDWTPEAAGFINGFAQSNYWLPRPEGESGTRHTIFHRVIKDFMAQTGDPNGHTRNQTSVTHGPGFTFEDEFHPALLFTGRGQMAMANAGFDSLYKGTNSSQWFVTQGPTRHLDFNHTIFGQLIRGWELLDKINLVKLQDQPLRTDLPAGTVDTPEQDSSPVAPIEITGSSVVANLTDAVLLVSAEAPGTATITVTVKDGNGGTATRSFTVTAAHDEHNAPPFFAQYPLDAPLGTAQGTAFPLAVLDLEDDYLFVNSFALSGNAISQVAGNTLQVFPFKRNADNTTSPTTGKHVIGMSASQYDMTGQSAGGTDDQKSATFVVGEKAIVSEGLPVTGTPGTAFTAPVATFTDSDARGEQSGYSAKINWGDGTTPAQIPSQNIVRDPSQPGLVAYRISASHTGYARPGTYPVKVTLETSTGLKREIRTIAVISADPLKVIGEAVNAPGGKVKDAVVATIQDADAAEPGAYSVLLNWGDGSTSDGVVKRAGDGRLFIAASHEYADSDSYSILVQVTKEGAAAPVTGWATARVSGVDGPRVMPPFQKARIISDITQISTKKGVKPLLTTVGSGMNEQTMATVGVVVISRGAAKVPASKIRFYLSADRTLNLQDEEYEDTTVEPPVTRINPKDIPVTVGRKKDSLKIIPLKPGMGGQVNFDKTSADTRLYFPKREPGVGYHLLAYFDYEEPLVPQSSRYAVEDLGTPITVIGPDTSRQNDGAPTLELMENPGSHNVRTFIVRIGRRPATEVKIPLSIAGSFGQSDPSEFYFTAKPPAEDKYLTESPDYEVVFTPEMWDQGTKEQIVSLTAKNDNANETSDQRLSVRVGAAKSMDPLFHGRQATPLTVWVRDANANVVVSRTSITTKEPSVHATFEISLRTPLPVTGTSVSIRLTSGNPAEGKLAIPDGTAEEKVPKDEIIVVLNATTTKKTIQVVAQDDAVDEPTNPQYTITTHPTESDDPKFHGVNPADITVTNEDND